MEHSQDLTEARDQREHMLHEIEWHQSFSMACARKRVVTAA
jgi:hypothetical protein